MRKEKLISLFLCFVLLLACTAVCAQEATEYSLLDSGYVRLLGRGEIKGENSRTFNWLNAGFEFEFSGTKAEVYVDEVLVPDENKEYKSTTEAISTWRCMTEIP